MRVDIDLRARYGLYRVIPRVAWQAEHESVLIYISRQKLVELLAGNKDLGGTGVEQRDYIVEGSEGGNTKEGRVPAYRLLEVRKGLVDCIRGDTSKYIAYQG